MVCVWGSLGQWMIVKGRVITLGEDCGCSHSFPHWASSWGLQLAVSIQAPFPNT